MAFDVELFRASVAIQSLLDFPDDVLSRPGVAERITAMAGAHEPPAPPGPSREDVLRLMTA